MTFWTRHGAHLIVLGGPLVLMLGMAVALRLGAPGRTHASRDTLTGLVAVAWLASTAVHVLVIREHFEEATVLGVFFLVLSLLQLGYVAWLWWAPSPELLVLGLVTNLGVIGLWAYTRTVAVPFGLGPREGVGVADVTATAFEAVAVVLAGAALRRWYAHDRVGRRARGPRPDGRALARAAVAEAAGPDGRGVPLGAR